MTSDSKRFLHPEAIRRIGRLELRARHIGNLRVYATAADLGLATGDVIDALILSDVAPLASIGTGGDEVLFSLAPGSPTLATNGYSAADVLSSPLDGAVPTRRATAADLGLADGDNVDALDIGPALIPVDCNGNGVADAVDIDTGTSLDLNMNGIPDECEDFVTAASPAEMPSYALYQNVPAERAPVSLS